MIYNSFCTLGDLIVEPRASLLFVVVCISAAAPVSAGDLREQVEQTRLRSLRQPFGILRPSMMVKKTWHLMQKKKT
jgi:hypothetical protein